MVKTPKMRHSKTTRDPVTIDLDPAEVTRLEAAAARTDETEKAAATDRAEMSGAAAATPSAEPAAPEPAAADAREEPAVVHEGPESAGADPAGTTPFGRQADGDVQAEGGRQARSEDVGAADRNAEPRLPPRPDGRRGALGPALLGGVAGGAVALAVVWAWNGFGPPADGGAGGDPAAVAALREQVAALETRIGALPEGNGAAVDELRQSLAGATARIDELGAGLEQARSDLAGLKSAAEAGSGGDGTALQAVQDRIAALEAAVGTIGTDSGADQRAAVEKLSTEVAELRGAVESAGGTASELGTRIAAAEQALSSLSAKVEAQAEQPRIALAIAASALKAAIDRGGTFATEIETFAAVAPDAAELAELRQIAKEGVPSRADLAADAPEATAAIIAAARTVDDHAGFFERLLSSAESLVEVRPIGAIEGEGVPAIAARMEAAVRDGDLAGALAEYETLPPEPKAAGAAYAEKLRLRLKAEELVDKALSGALKAS